MKCRAEGAYEPGHGGHKLVDLLRILDPETVSLIGHSAGCIHICHLIAANRNLHIKEVIFTAPAARKDLFQNSLIENNALVSNVDRLTIFMM